MKNNLVVKGQQNFMGKEIPIVLGGFGEDKKCVSDKTIAEIHNQPAREIRRRISDNIKRFSENVDFIELKKGVGESHTYELLQTMFYTKQEITQAEHIYILSERGYAKLIKIMDSDLAWEIHDKLIDDYFQLREEKQKAKLDNKGTSKPRLASVNMAAKIIQGVYKEAGVEPLYIAVAVNKLYKNEAGIDFGVQLTTTESKLYDCTEIARLLKIKSSNGNYHDKAVSAIIQKLNVSDDEKVNTPFEKNGCSGITVQYKESVFYKVKSWLEENNYPTVIDCKLSNGKTNNYRVFYIEVA